MQRGHAKNREIKMEFFKIFSNNLKEGRKGENKGIKKQKEQTKN